MEKNPCHPYLPAGSWSRMSSVRWISIAIGLLILYSQHHWATPCLPWLFRNANSSYEGESLAWKACGQLALRQLECSRITVPLNHFNSSQDENLVFDLPLVRLRGQDGSKNVFVSPGGPGVSGVDFLHNRGARLHDIIGSGFHIVAFDARGVNGARPAALCYPTRADKARLSTTQFKSIAQSAEAYEWTKGFVRSCRETTGEYGAYINTPQIAADMNMMLDALGQAEMYYWGISWGSVLGQTYASMYPERAHRMIVDGIVDATKWYGDRFSDSSSLKDAEKVLHGFFEECVKAGDECPLSHMAGTATELENLVLDFAHRLEEPLSVYVDNTRWGVLHFEDLVYNGFFGMLYSPSTWWSTADRLAKLLQGDASGAFTAWAGQGPYDDWLTDEALYFIANNDQLTGAEHWPQDRLEFLDLVRPLLNETLFSPAQHLELYKLQQWSLPKTHTFRLPRNIKTAHPMLVLSMEWDPVTPFDNTHTVTDVFTGSRTIKLAGYGHTTFAMPSACIARHVHGYLSSGILPEENATCQVDGRYFGNPKEDASWLVIGKDTRSPRY